MRASRARGALAPVQREAIVLFEIDGYAIEEIAAMQRVSVSAVKSRLARGRERLRRFYTRHGWLLAPGGRAVRDPSRDAAASGPRSGLVAGPVFGVAGEEAGHE